MKDNLFAEFDRVFAPYAEDFIHNMKLKKRIRQANDRFEKVYNIQKKVVTSRVRFDDMVVVFYIKTLRSTDLGFHNGTKIAASSNNTK